MRKTLFILGTLVLIVSGVIFWSCQKEEILTNSEDATLKKAPAKETPDPDLLISFDPVQGLVDEVVTILVSVSYEGEPVDCGQIQLFYGTDESGNPVGSDYEDIVWVNAVPGNINAPGGSSTATYSSPGFYAWKAHYQSSGPDCNYDNITGNDAVIADIEIVSLCQETFSYETSDNMNIIFTYISENEISGAEVKLTCPHVDIDLNDEGLFEGNDDKTYIVNNDGSKTTLTWTGDIEECVPITFDVTLTPDCEQNQGGHANVWTDFKVNEISKKGVTPPEEGADCVNEGTELEPIIVCYWPIIKYDCQ